MKLFDSALGNKAAKVIVAASAMVGSAQAFALDAAVGTAIDTQLAALQADGGEIAGKVWPVIIALAGMVIAIKLFKRFISKV